MNSKEKKQINHLKFSESPYIAELKQVEDRIRENKLNDLTCDRLKYTIKLQNYQNKWVGLYYERGRPYDLNKIYYL